MNGRIIAKRIHVRIEHVEPSRCREDFLSRRLQNEEIKAKGRADGSSEKSENDGKKNNFARLKKEAASGKSLKRQPAGPKPGFAVEGKAMETVTPIPYDVVNDLKGGY